MLDAKPDVNDEKSFVSLDDRHIAKVYVCAKGAINGIKLEFTNGTCTKWHGRQEAQPNVFVLEEGEAIIRVFCNASTNKILGLRFETSLGEYKPLRVCCLSLIAVDW
jgi:hypothetical protein